MSAEQSVRYFSNSSEGEPWMARNCRRCIHDHQFHVTEDNGCEHVLSLITDQYNPVFFRTTETGRGMDGMPVEYETWGCIEFARCACDNGPDDPGVEPKPTPDPNQGALFDTDELMPGVWRDVVLDTFPTDRLGGVPAFPAEAPTATSTPPTSRRS